LTATLIEMIEEVVKLVRLYQQNAPDEELIEQVKKLHDIGIEPEDIARLLLTLNRGV